MDDHSFSRYIYKIHHRPSNILLTPCTYFASCIQSCFVESLHCPPSHLSKATHTPANSNFNHLTSLIEGITGCRDGCQDFQALLTQRSPSSPSTPTLNTPLIGLELHSGCPAVDSLRLVPPRLVSGVLSPVVLNNPAHMTLCTVIIITIHRFTTLVPPTGQASAFLAIRVIVRCTGLPHLGRFFTALYPALVVAQPSPVRNIWASSPNLI